MALRCGLVGDVEVFDRFRVFLTSTLGVSSVMGLGPFAEFAVPLRECCPARLDPGNPQLCDHGRCFVCHG
jgi:hypothetical protein